ncbi:MAG: 2-deoxy-D-gluconate 3-dehydrogenase [Ignavibacteriae bacterium HGW-Ignavibacteriae-3]|nr:MAG: 2-deoxy-D-gluconate 3-dehydrogenase [Ignavibacteriae bacterium HGW-Ignavibacteriae-3]
MNTLFDLNGKSAIVTGSSTGLGQGMAIGLATAGADVVLVDYVDSSETAERISSLGRKAVTVVANLMEMSSIPLVVEKTIGEFGKIDILVNNAGIIRRTDAIDFSEKDWDDVMLLNSKTIFFLAQAVAKDMMKRKSGKIISTASLLSFQGGIRVPSYAASKGAVAQITKALANEWAQFGINVNAIAPGYMATNNTTALREDPARSKSILERIPAGVWGKPEDLQGAVIFLASSASNYVNGHVLVVDGGWMAR